MNIRDQMLSTARAYPATHTWVAVVLLVVVILLILGM